MTAVSTHLPHLLSDAGGGQGRNERDTLPIFNWLLLQNMQMNGVRPTYYRLPTPDHPVHPPAKLCRCYAEVWPPVMECFPPVKMTAPRCWLGGNAYQRANFLKTALLATVHKNLSVVFYDGCDELVAHSLM